jgi:hypothetical protein
MRGLLTAVGTTKVVMMLVPGLSAPGRVVWVVIPNHFRQAVVAQLPRRRHPSLAVPSPLSVLGP